MHLRNVLVAGLFVMGLQMAVSCKQAESDGSDEQQIPIPPNLSTNGVMAKGERITLLNDIEISAASSEHSERIARREDSSYLGDGKSESYVDYCYLVAPKIKKDTTFKAGLSYVVASAGQPSSSGVLIYLKDAKTGKGAPVLIRCECQTLQGTCERSNVRATLSNSDDVKVQWKD